MFSNAFNIVLILQKFHRIVIFNQKLCLVKNTFEQNFFKLLNNAVYGKTMENIDKRKDIKIVGGWENRKKRLGA